MQATFIIPIRIDTEDRLSNLEVALRYLRTCSSSCELIVSEQAEEPSVQHVCERHGAYYRFIKNSGPFCKAYGINDALSRRNHDIIAVYDADVIAPIEGMLEAIRQIREEGRAVVLPYNQLFINIKGAIRASYIDDPFQRTLSFMTRRSMVPLSPDIEPKILQGGCMFFDARKLEAEGGFNRRMVGYGWEDTEVHVRLRKAGYFMRFLTQFSLVHLDHRRGPDSSTSAFTERNKQEFEYIKSLNKTQIRRYIDKALMREAVESSSDRDCRRSKLDRNNALTMASIRWRLHWAHSNAVVRL